MSVKRMITKLALAFAAKKGMEVLNNAGGIDGLRRTLAGEMQAGGGRDGMLGRIGGSGGSAAGGLGSILGALGSAGATGAREAGVTGQVSPLNAPLGQLFGALASALGQNAQPEEVGRATSDIGAGDAGIERDVARSVIRAMVQVARSDGHIDDAEQDALFEILDDASADEREMLKDALREPVDAGSVASDTPQHARGEVYTAALFVADDDNTRERAYLERLAGALNLTEAEVDRLHDAMKKRPLPV